MAQPPHTSLDHILWAVPDLESGIDDIEQRTGVRAAIGGRHPGVGTHNALLSLGEGLYFEIIAPDPSQDGFSGLGELLRNLTEPRLLTWAGRTDDAGFLAQHAEAHGMLGEAIPMSRRRPDGGRLSWRILQLGGHAGGELVPFFIEWDAGTPHPSTQTPRGCTLSSFWLEHPEPTIPAPLLSALGFDFEIRREPIARVRAFLDCPKGRVEL